MGDVVGTVVEPADRDQQQRATQVGVQLLDSTGGDQGSTAVAVQHDRDPAAALVAGQPQPDASRGSTSFEIVTLHHPVEGGLVSAIRTA